MATVDRETRVIRVRNFDFHYSPEDFVNADAYDFHHTRLWRGREPEATVIHTCGTVLAIVFPEYFAFTDQDALDTAADSGKLDSLLISDEELKDYETGKDEEGFPEYEGIIRLGNASEPFDSQHLDYFKIPAELFASDPVIAKIIADNPEQD